jgi:hypothetical protein
MTEDNQKPSEQTNLFELADKMWLWLVTPEGICDVCGQPYAHHEKGCYVGEYQAARKLP